MKYVCIVVMLSTWFHILKLYINVMLPNRVSKISSVNFPMPTTAYEPPLVIIFTSTAPAKAVSNPMPTIVPTWTEEGMSCLYTNENSYGQLIRSSNIICRTSTTHAAKQICTFVINSPSGLHPNNMRRNPERITAAFPSALPIPADCKWTATNMDIAVGGAMIKGKLANNPVRMLPNAETRAYGAISENYCCVHNFIPRQRKCCQCCSLLFPFFEVLQEENIRMQHIEQFHHIFPLKLLSLFHLS